MDGSEKEETDSDSSAMSSGSDKINPDEYKTGLEYNDAKDIFNKGAKIINFLRNIAATVSVITLTILGIRYMMGSIEEKAEYKQTMVPVAVACVMVASLSGILTFIQSVF